MAMGEPVSSTKTRSWLDKSAAWVRQAARSASFCSLALIVFFSRPAQRHSGPTDGGRADFDPGPFFPHLAMLLSGGIGIGLQLFEQASL